ncbi:MAG: hypothetical protein CVV61_04550 [Tenericutes bacterium HGW-Tenericutes-6]|nr:MAG: hypothetical protein CVV61_04550 [Tenericutes bacterium HGW-Tenericutes-6]
MFKKKKTDTLNLYNKNPETNAYMIEVSIEDYAEIFNGWDASPLRRKDIEPELIDYLEQASTEIPMKENLELVFYLDKKMFDQDKEQKSLTGIKNNFKFIIYLINQQLNLKYRQMATYIILSMLFITGAYVLRNLVELSLLTNIMVEGFFIGGWFLLWEAFSIFVFDSHQVRLRKKLYTRFLNSVIIFREPKE